MQSTKLAGTKPGVPVQRYLDVAEIKEDIVIMKDGTIRAILLVSSINFSLKSMDEQNAIVQAYMQFLNGLDFPIQILIQSRRMNIDEYLRKLKDAEKGQGNELLKRQITDYRDFVKWLVETGDIMQKKFFVVVPLDPSTDKQKGFFARLSEIITPSVAIHLSDEKFRKNKESLMLRVNSIISGLQSMSLNAVMLDTQSTIELLYTMYNPELFESERMVNTSKLQTEG
ncbi:MAG: TraC family protein [Patescibacteria group bacterium]|nr:TraC family protein [Patescibacteria group bacterium]